VKLSGCLEQKKGDVVKHLGLSSKIADEGKGSRDTWKRLKKDERSKVKK